MFVALEVLKRALNRRRVLVGEISQLVVARRLRVDVPVSLVPEHRLVIQIVQCDASRVGRPVARHQMLYPTLHEGRRDRHPRIGRSVSGDLDAVWLDAVPQSGRHGSVFCCVSYFLTLKPQAYALLSGVHPMSGTVRSVFVLEGALSLRASFVRL